MEGYELPLLKGTLPVRLCVPSFLYRAGWAANVERVRSAVDEVELLFFESDARCGLPLPEEISRMASLARPAGLSFNVHLPLDIDVCSVDPAERARARQTILQVLALSAPLAPHTFVLHAPREAGLASDTWRGGLSEALSQLPEPHARFAVENTDSDLRACADILSELRYSVCMDLGHLLARGEDPERFVDTFGPSVTMIHLHGVRDGRDHLPLSVLSPAEKGRLAALLRRMHFAGTLSVEVFSVDGFMESLPTLREVLPW